MVIEFRWLGLVLVLGFCPEIGGLSIWVGFRVSTDDKALFFCPDVHVCQTRLSDPLRFLVKKK